VTNSDSSADDLILLESVPVDTIKHPRKRFESSGILFKNIALNIQRDKRSKPINIEQNFIKHSHSYMFRHYGVFIRLTFIT